MSKILLALATLMFASAAPAAADIVTAPEAWAEARKGKLVIVDVRSPGEWRRTGIPNGAKAITIHDPGGMPAFVAKIKAAVKGDRSTRIALICAAGGRSHRAQAALRLAGFTNVQNVSEGMLGRGAGAPGWLKRNLPTESWTPK
jgi:rhodanese-related sulfurtransferase